MFEFTDENFKKEVLNSKLPVLVNFWAVWCGPCKAMAPLLDEVAVNLDKKVKVGKVNVDENPKTTDNFGIMNIPTLIFFKDGKEQARTVGIYSKTEVLKKIEGLI